MPRLYLVRHAEPAVKGVLLGQSDPPLSEEGHRHAATLSTLIVEAVVTSPLQRALQTASYIKAPLSIDPGLAELHLGDWDGRTWAEVEQADPAFAQRKLQDWFGLTPPGGEPWANFVTRVHHACDRILTGPSPRAIVAHIAVNAVIAQRLSGADAHRFHQHYCQILCYDY